MVILGANGTISPEDLAKADPILRQADYLLVQNEINAAAVEALLRRAKIVSEHQLVIGKTTLDYDTFSVTTDGREQILPQKEFCLLYKLLSYPNQVFTRLQLMDDIWGPSSESTPATVSVHINRLRNRFRNAEDFSIVTIRGLGYKAQIKKSPAI